MTSPRPASLQLQRPPTALMSSTDGACLFSVEEMDGGLHLQAYHWSSFGSSAGIGIDLPGSATKSIVLTSLGGRSRCHLIVMNIEDHSLESTALDITHKVTEFTFQAEDDMNTKHVAAASSIHNSLIDCHADVWTRFPVVPAVHRHTVKSAHRAPQTLSFVSHLEVRLFEQYFTQLVARFQTTTKKPIGGVLDTITIHGAPYHSFLKQDKPDVSTHKAGEWLVDILCLIPIHLAVARDNRFIPLKDGVFSAEQEQALLGATVDQVIDNLSFGWYESIFRSYMASKVSDHQTR